MTYPCVAVRRALLAITFAVHGIATSQEARIGRVVDPTETGVADAELKIIDRATKRVIARTRTSESGAFSLNVSKVDDCSSLVVTAKDFVELRLSSVELSRAGELLRLRPAATMTGRVTDVQSRAIAGASIVVALEPQDGSDRDMRWTASTNADGEFSIDGVPLGNFHVAIAAARYRYLDEPKTWSGDPCVFVLEDGVETPLSVVVRALDRSMMPGCEVRVRAQSKLKHGVPLPPMLARGVTDANGAWSARGPEEFDYRITVHHAGYQDSVEHCVSVGQRDRERTFIMRPLEELPVRGHVVDASGTPVSNLFVQVRDHHGKTTGTATTDEQGAFAATTSLRLADRFRFEISSMPHNFADVWWSHDPETDHRITLNPTTPVFGQVVGADGLPVAYQAVWLCYEARAAPHWSPKFHVVTDRRGKFEFVGGVPTALLGSSGPKTRARLETMGIAGWCHSKPFDLDRGVLPAFRIECEPGARLRGRVVNNNGTPIPGLQLYFCHVGRTLRTPVQNGVETMIHTARDGRFTLSGFAPGRYDAFHSPPLMSRAYFLKRGSSLVLEGGETLDVELIQQ